MQIQNCNFYQYKSNYTPNFDGIANFNLSYIIRERSNLVPSRMLQVINEVLVQKPKTEPTLRELHLKTYAPLLDCKTLDEARNLFDEFREVLDAAIFETSPSKNIKELKQHIVLKDLSLRLLQDTWARLKTQDEIAQDLGLKDRHQLEWFKRKINFVNKDKNYSQLLKRSDPELHAQMSAKTTAYNQAHPEQMYERNKKAAQAFKRPELRAAKREQSRQMYIDNPELREEARRRTTRAWELMPARDISISKTAINAYVKKKYPNASPERQRQIAESIFFRKFWKQYDAAPEDLSKAMKRAGQEINEEIEKEKGAK